jgi:hypothetical protein
MIYWYLLNYKIYKFYQSRGEMFPDVYSWAASAGLINLNFYPLIHIWLEHHQYVNLYGSRITSIVQLLPFLTISYFTLYYKSKYVKIFSEIDQNRGKYDFLLSYVKYYIIFSIVITILWVVISTYVKHGGW